MCLQICLQVFHHTWSPIQQYQSNEQLVAALETHQTHLAIPHHYIKVNIFSSMLALVDNKDISLSLLSFVFLSSMNKLGG